MPREPPRKIIRKPQAQTNSGKSMHPARADLIRHGLIVNATPEERIMAHEILGREEARKRAQQKGRIWSSHWLEKEAHLARPYITPKLIDDYVKAGETPVQKLKRLAACTHNESTAQNQRRNVTDQLIFLTDNVIEASLPNNVEVKEAFEHLTISFRDIRAKLESQNASREDAWHKSTLKYLDRILESIADRKRYFV